MPAVALRQIAGQLPPDAEDGILNRLWTAIQGSADLAYRIARQIGIQDRRLKRRKKAMQGSFDLCFGFVCQTLGLGVVGSGQNRIGSDLPQRVFLPKEQSCVPPDGIVDLTADAQGGISLEVVAAYGVIAADGLQQADLLIDDILSGDVEASQKYCGRYLSEYSWAEERNGELIRILFDSLY